MFKPTDKNTHDVAKEVHEVMKSLNVVSEEETMKVITICGILSFKEEMMIIAEKLALEGNCILTPVYPVKNFSKTDTQLKK